jgi:hypothetical protein
MKITYTKGKKTSEDTIMKIESEGVEVVTLLDIAYYVNQLAINELKIIQGKNLSKDLHFWFKNLIDKAIQDAKENKDWNKESEYFFQGLLERPYFIKRDSLNKFLNNRA